MRAATAGPLHSTNALSTVVAFALTLLFLVDSIGSQVTPEEHAAHHPEQQGQGPVQGPPSAGPGGGMMGGMGDMMSKMGVPPPKELYPSLMELPDLPSEMRADVQAKAHERMLSGVAQLSAGLDGLVGAAPGDDWSAMQVAVQAMHDGLAEFESGLAAHQALSEGKAPRSVALQWFKSQMNLMPSLPAPEHRGPFGFGWFHLSIMVILGGFAVAMLWMYSHKMRRASELLESLVGAGSPAPSGTSVVAAGAGPQSSPAALGSNSTGTPDSAAKPVRWSGKLKVCRVFTETPSIKTFRLVAEDGADPPFSFLPGQFLTLSVRSKEKSVKRSYTISSSPTVSGYVEIAVKREDQGIVSRFLHDDITEGDSLDVSAPMGKFTFTGKEASSVVLIGGGVGVTPLMSVVRYLTDTGWGGQIILLFVCRDMREYLFRKELEARQQRHPNLKVVVTMSREKHKSWKGPRGRLTKDLIAGSVVDIAKQRIHVCGPGPMMASVKETLDLLGVPAANVKTEAFGPTKAKVAAPGGEVVKPPATQTAAATVTFAGSQKAGPIQVGETILDVAEAVGVDIENSCRTGSCGSCKVKLLEGAVEMEAEDSLEPAEKAEGWVLACQATTKASVKVDA